MEILKEIWLFFQDQILEMKWLNHLIGNILSAMGLDMNSRLGGSFQFVIYDVIKITVLLCLLIFFISYIQSYFPPERSKKILGRFDGIGANTIAVIGGTLIEKLHMEKYVEDFIKKAISVDIDSPSLTKKDRVAYAKEQIMGISICTIGIIIVGYMFNIFHIFLI